jgi:NTP pyrophosphatase (non-canonical NTP hydrolase)
MEQLIRDILETGYTVDKSTWELGDVKFKLDEELGELSEAIQIKRGKLNRPVGKDDEFGELADVMNCLVDMVSRVNPGMPPEEFIDRLKSAMDRKTKKWQNCIANSHL